MNSHFNKIYWINSRNRMDRFRNMIERFRILGVEAERFDAIYGGSLDHSTLNMDKSSPILLADGTIGTRFRLLNNGEIGCFISHTTIYQKIKENGFDKTLILEDDAIFCDGFKDKFEEQMKHVPEDWDMIYFGQWNYDHPAAGTEHLCGTMNLKEKVSGDVYKADRCWLTHAYAVRLKCIDYLIDNTKELYASIDNVLADIQKELKVYAIHPALINQDGTKSSLR